MSDNEELHWPSGMYYVLNDNGEPKEAKSHEEWIEWAKRKFEKGDNYVVKQERIKGILVSTVFLGLNHRFSFGLDGIENQHPPILWETMTFCPKRMKNSKLDQLQTRCSGSREQALAMHEKMIAHVRKYARKRTKAKTKRIAQ